jgi:hypothetical protein
MRRTAQQIVKAEAAHSNNYTVRSLHSIELCPSTEPRDIDVIIDINHLLLLAPLPPRRHHRLTTDCQSMCQELLKYRLAKAYFHKFKN